jgi:hypothetical protein
MRSMNNRSRGWLNRKQGLSFQSLCKQTANAQGFVALEVKDGVKKTGPQGKTLLPVPNLFDLIVLSQHDALFCDCKVRDAKTITPSMFAKPSTRRQVQELATIRTKTGFKAGFIVYLKELSRTVFVDALDVLNSSKGSTIPFIYVSNTMAPDFCLILKKNKLA